MQLKATFHSMDVLLTIPIHFTYAYNPRMSGKSHLALVFACYCGIKFTHSSTPRIAKNGCDSRFV